MKIRDLSLSDCARILKRPRVGVTTAAILHNWPGKPEGSGHWRVPAKFIQTEFNISETEIVRSLAERKEIH